MTFKHSILAIAMITFVSSSSFAQYTYDIGLKISSYDMERLQFDARYHLNSKYSLLLNLASGRQRNSFYSATPVYEDSLITISRGDIRETNYSFKVGVQRKIDLFATDVFYGGATLGVSNQHNRGLLNSDTYVTDSTGSFPSYPLYLGDSPSTEDISNRIFVVELFLSFGMDVPLSDRFSINAELGLSSSFRHSLTYADSYFIQRLAVSGGIRYAFGSRT